MRGHEEQAIFNEKVEEAIASAQLELEGPSTSAAIGKSKEKPRARFAAAHRAAKANKISR